MTVKAMTAEQLTKKIVGKEPLFLLDVRNQADVQDWKIEGEAIVDMNVPYFDLLDGVEGLYSTFLVTVKCWWFVPRKVPLSWWRRCCQRLACLFIICRAA